MKKFIIPVLALLALVSCTAKFDEMNKPTTGLTMDSAQPMYIFGRTLYNGSSNDHQRNFNLNDDMYAHYFADGLGWTDFWRYNAGWGDIYWRDFYTDRLQEYWLINDICGETVTVTRLTSTQKATSAPARVPPFLTARSRTSMRT